MNEYERAGLRQLMDRERETGRREGDADLRAKVQALVEKVETDLAMSQVTAAYEATDTLQMLIESPEFIAVKAAIEGQS